MKRGEYRMKVKTCLGLEKEMITDSEILDLITKAKMNQQDIVEIKGIKIKLNKDQCFECGILD